jgi:hypothetical protein
MEKREALGEDDRKRIEEMAWGCLEPMGSMR